MSCYRQTPICVSPCDSRPICGFGSGGSGSGIIRYGGLGSGGGMSAGGMSAGGMSAGSLGIIPGVVPSCVSQIPPSEVMIQPPPYILTIPGPVLAASCEPVAVTGYSPCASGQGLGSLGMGSSQGYLGSGCRGIYGSKRRSSYCPYPC